MLIEFSLGNFWSFKEIQSLNMTSAKINELIDTNTIKIDEKVSVLKSKAIYGANASGKSNIIKGLVSFIRIVKNSVKDENILKLIKSFQLSDETINEPSFFQIIFVLNNIQYRYGFEATDTEIKSEWLFGVPGKREVCFFIRENNKLQDISEKHFNEGKKLLSLFGDTNDNNNNEIFRNNSLFLSAVASMNGKFSQQLVNKISSTNVLTGLSDKQLFNVAGSSLKDKNQKNNIIEFLKIADTGINSLNLIELSKKMIADNSPEELRQRIDEGEKFGIIISEHNKYDKNKEKIGTTNLHFRATQSEGTIKMFEISPFIINALSKGNTIVIDEFDARFHPLITKKIIELFNSIDNNKSQLIFVTHDTNLLSHELLRRDQIDFVEKDNCSESHLYTLVQFKGIRNNASFEKDYISGKYGAIPFLGDFKKLLKIENNV